MASNPDALNIAPDYTCGVMVVVCPNKGGLA